MKRKKQTKKNRNTKTISAQVLASAQQLLKTKVIDISEWREAKISAEDYQKTVISEENLSKLDPVHGIYAYAQNQLSVFIEQLAQLPALSQLTHAHADAEDKYMPSGPPISPLTKSYFTCWGFFDLCSGSKKETFASVTIDLCRFLNIDAGLIRVFEKMQDSRMGLYIQEGSEEKHVYLRELITNREIKTVVGSGYRGNKGEIWLARVVPPPFDDNPSGYAFVLTTPYLVGELRDATHFKTGNEKGWLAFFDRNLKRTGITDRVSAYESLMKYGLNRNFWNEYILLAYVNHLADVILLAGYPDMPDSLPHSALGQERLGL